MGQGIRLTEIVEKMDLKTLTPEVEMVEKEVNVPDVNRPALQLAGFFDHFDSNRVQIIGNVEYRYVNTLTKERQEYIYKKLLEHPIPCIVFCRDMEPEEEFLRLATERGVPVFKTSKQTSAFFSVTSITYFHIDKCQDRNDNKYEERHSCRVTKIGNAAASETIIKDVM